MLNTKGHSKEYDEYINSEAWRIKSERIKRLRGYRCERCGSTNQIDAHHKNYDRLGNEKDSDIEVVCRKCHGGADKERAEFSSRRNFQKRLDAWADKVYGDNWRERYTYDSVCECFIDWLDQQERSDWVVM